MLGQAGFDRDRDRLWLVGDLINRGPESLEVLRFVHALGARARVVLGNHEVHLLAVAEGARPLKAFDTLQPILDAPDRAVLLDWLRRQPLLHVDRELGYCMAHAGIPPHWDVHEAEARAREAEAWIQRNGFGKVAVASMSEPLELSDELDAAARARVIVSYFTRMRVCTSTGRLDFAFKGTAEQSPAGYLPWFAHPGRKTRGERIIFGHWAALDGHANAADVFALDTGCAWGRTLTVMRLEDGVKYGCPCVSLRPMNESGSSRHPA